MRDVRRLVLGEGVRWSASGALSDWCWRRDDRSAIRGLLFEVEPLDPAAFGATFGLLMTVAGLALYVPMRQASQVDAATILRAE